MTLTLDPRQFWRQCCTVLALLACMLFLAAPAQADPPGRIGRIAWLAGTVTLQNESGETFSATLNQPLTSGDLLTLEAGARAEIEIGSKTVRLDAGSVLELERIDDELVRLYLSEGRAIVALPTREALGDFEMATVNGQFTASEPGIYRFAADRNGSSATVYAGRLQFAGEGSSLELRASASAQFWQDGQTRSRPLALVNDEFSAWSGERDRLAAANANPAYARYVSPEMTGAADLDTYGNWSETPEYGAIWYPRGLAVDWAPYRSGNWVWVAPWGWSWVAYEPWGFAPFHYGRWVHHHGRWGWAPGTRIARPVYAPAMVAWIGRPGHRAGVGGRPTVGWFPLAPHEVYVPSYRSSANYLRQINVTHVARMPEAARIVNDPQAFVARTRYAHRELPRAVTVVPAEVVTQRRSVAPAAFAPGDRRRLRDEPLQAVAPLPAPAAETRTTRSTRAAELRPARQAEAGRPVPDIGRGDGRRPDNFTPRPGMDGGRGALAPSSPAPAALPAPAPAPARAAAPTAPQREQPAPPPLARPATPLRQEVASPPARLMPPSVERREPAAPSAQVITAPRSEPARSESVQSAPAARTEAPEPRAQERSFRREDTPSQRAPQPRPQFAPQATAQAAPRQTQREVRVEPQAQIIHQAPAERPTMPSAPAPEARREAPREVRPAPAARVENRPPADAERPRAADKEDRRHRNESDRR